MNQFDEFCSFTNADKKLKLDCAIDFIWYHQQVIRQPEITIKEINKYFFDAHLSAYNPTFLKRDLNRSSSVTKGSKTDSYKLRRNILEDLNKKYASFIDQEITIIERANLNSTPFLELSDIENAKKMAELYVITHCLENSIRNLIEKVMKTKYGENWWNAAKNSEQERKVNERKAKEAKNKWLSPRGHSSPLFYLDWGDLVKIIKKFEADFSQFIDEVKFVELRLEDLEKIRNIIAHNGVIPSQDDFDRVILHFKDWCKQVS